MERSDVGKFLRKISGCYPNQFFITEEIKEEWSNRLKPYDTEDVERKFEEHLNGERANEPPKVHFLIKYLRTKKEKERAQTDYLIRCNLCGEEMYLSEYDGKHFDRCLLLHSVHNVLKEHGKEVSIEELDAHDNNTLERVFEKYNEPKTSITDIFS